MRIDDIIKITTKSDETGIMTKLTLLKSIGINCTYYDGTGAGHHLGFGFSILCFEIEFVIRLWNGNAA